MRRRVTMATPPDANRPLGEHIMAEYRGADRAADKANKVRAEGGQRRGEWIFVGEVELTEDQSGRGAVDEEIIPFDRGADSRRDNRFAWRAKVKCSGRRRFTDGVLAHVRTPGGPTSPAQPLFRLSPTGLDTQTGIQHRNVAGMLVGFLGEGGEPENSSENHRPYRGGTEGSNPSPSSPESCANH
jgi:hypothetical protein